MRSSLVLLFVRWNSYRQLISLSSRSIVILLAMSFLATLSEALGLSIFYPIVEFVKNDGNISVLTSDSELWSAITSVYKYIGLNLTLATLIFVAFSLLISRQLFLYMKSIYQIKLSTFIVKKLRNSMFKSYMEADSNYQDLLPVGDFTEVVSRETSSSTSGILGVLGLITDFVTLIAFLSILMFISWHMTIIASIVLFITSFAPKVWIRKSVQAGRDVVSSRIKLSSFLIDRLKSPRLARLSGIEFAENNEFSLITKKLRDSMITKDVLKNKTDAIMEPVVISLSLLFLYFSIDMLSMPLGQVGLYMLVSIRLLPVVKGIMVRIQVVKSAMGSIEIVTKRIEGMFNSKEVDTGKIKMSFLNQSIKLDSVYFRYTKNKIDTLSDLTLEIPAKGMTAIVGPSGSGKSTLIDLFPRLRNPQKGSIFFDGILINNINLRSLRGLISYTPQNPQIFNTTIKQHIKYGKLDATMEEVKRAAELSGIAEFIETLPFKYDTTLGEGSIRLSGGQQQRLDLARALVRKSSILILDEPTSNLDANSEEEFREVINSILVKTSITIIIISHRLKGIMSADKIIVLNQGKIEAVGKHDELMNSSGWYKKAWNIQAR
jgi:ABC-type multidrug transport system fused ATPase/permease subunit